MDWKQVYGFLNFNGSEVRQRIRQDILRAIPIKEIIGLGCSKSNSYGEGWLTQNQNSHIEIHSNSISILVHNLPYPIT